MKSRIKGKKELTLKTFGLGRMGAIAELIGYATNGQKGRHRRKSDKMGKDMCLLEPAYSLANSTSLSLKGFIIIASIAACVAADADEESSSAGSADMTQDLVSASSLGDLDQLAGLLNQGADPNGTNGYGLTPLHVARLSGHQVVVDLLVGNGANPDIPMPSLDAFVDAMFNEKFQAHSPGAAVLVSQDGEIIFKRGYGYANLEHRVPFTPETRSRIGSITKQFTAAAILHLQERGKLDVQDKLSEYLPGYPRGEEVTIHHLLGHTSGIHSYTRKSDFLEMVRLFIEPKDLIESFLISTNKCKELEALVCGSVVCYLVL